MEWIAGIVVIVFLYCVSCGRNTKHESHQQGDWEVYRCEDCGSEQQYKTR